MVYLQVGYSANNYFGWTWAKQTLITAKEYYESDRFNLKKAEPNDFTLNKGGMSVTGEFGGMFRCEMTTDN